VASPHAQSSPILKEERDQVFQLREHSVLESAALCVLREGCSKVTVAGIASSCGIAKGTFYLHFQSRGEVIGAALERLDRALEARLRKAARDGRGASPQLRLAIREGAEAQESTMNLAWAQRLSGASAGSLASGDGVLDQGLWPCCLRSCPCPYGGAARSLAVLSESNVDGSGGDPDSMASRAARFLLGAAAARFRNMGCDEDPALGREARAELLEYLLDRLLD